MQRASWGTRFGFYLAAIGCAFGIGNLWRFPYIVAENGGGAFALIYVLFAFVFGLPLLLGELALGKLSRKSVVAACERTALPQWKKAARWAGLFSVAICVGVLSYYVVISGWVLHYMMHFLFASLKLRPLNPEGTLQTLRESGFLQMALTGAHIAIIYVVASRGLQQGMERWLGLATPIFVFLLVILILRSLTLPSAPEAIRFMFYPDFKKLTTSSLLIAFGHVCFTLSIGFGSMVTFGSYLRERDFIPEAGFRVSALDTFISLLAGILVFPIAMGLGISATGPELLFLSLPKFISELKFGVVLGFAFFLCLYLAALGASIGLFESVVANFIDKRNISRKRAANLVSLLLLCLAIWPAFSSNFLSGVTFGGKSFLEFLDSVLINWLLPLAALAICWIYAFHIDEGDLRREFVVDVDENSLKLFRHWQFLVKWVMPVMIVGLLLTQVFLFV